MAKQSKIEMNVEIDGKIYHVRGVSLLGVAEKTSWCDILLFRRKHELQYSGFFVAGSYHEAIRHQTYVVGLLGPPKKDSSFTIKIDL